MEPSGSVTRWIGDLRTSDRATRDEAAEAIWSRYAEQLLQLARRHLSARVRARTGASDVVQQMYHSFCRRMEGTAFPDLGGRDDLIRLLVQMTLNKARTAATRNTAGIRDVRREHGAGSDDAASPVALAAASEPTPDEAAGLADLTERLLSLLPDPCGRIVLGKLEGRTHEELAEELGCTVRTIERKMQLVRTVLCHLEGLSDDEIAGALKCSVEDVQRHLRGMRRT